MHNEQSEAARVVRSVLDGQTLQAALGQVDRTRGGHTLVHELAYGTLRLWGTYDAILHRLLAKPLSDPLLRTLIPVALYQLEHTRAPPFAIVDRAVEASAMVARPAAKALVNGVLRRFLREGSALHAAVRSDPVARWSYPRWWVARVKADFPQHWEAILAAGNRHPPLTLRVNARETTREALLALFARNGVAAHPIGVTGVVVETPRTVPSLPGYVEGWFAVQDAAAQHAAPLLQVRDGLRVLDACAAPGGKTTHLLELADVELIAIDADASRLARVDENLSRLKHAARRVTVMHGDAAAPQGWWDGRAFDRILADVPCTASGIVRRHPDGKWLRRADDIRTFAQAQQRLIEALWPLLASGGLLLYSTCSVFAAENEDRMQDFLARHDDALRETLTLEPDVPHIDGQLLPCSETTVHNQDGFFYALLRKA